MVNLRILLVRNFRHSDVSGWRGHLTDVLNSSEHRVHSNSGGHMHTPEIQMPLPGRWRGRYSDDFKRQVIASCLEPGVSMAAVALAHGMRVANTY